MRPPRRERTGARRDKGVRTIRTNDVRYPGADLPPLPEDGQATSPDAEADTRLGAVRDTGLALEGRLARQQRSRRRNTQRAAVATAVALAGLMLIAFAWRSASDQRAQTAPLGGTAASASIASTWAALVPAQSESTTSAGASKPATPGPTPYFARYRNLKLRSPIRVSALTEVGFHQASYSYALPMKTRLPDASLSSAGNHHGTHRNTSQQPKGPEAWLIGRVLRMWRARPGRPDTAADVGARPGTAVYAPVTGTVVKVKLYKLYNRWDDYEVHIQADGHPELDVVMIHLTSLDVVPGTRVQAGITQIAKVRKLSDKFYDQLASYTKDGGNHVHVQVNDARDPKYKGLKGAIAPRLVQPSTPDETTLTPDSSDR
jgi:hypothetical protein